MGQIIIILYSNPRFPEKSVIPNSKKIVLESENGGGLENIKHKLQFETEKYHLFNTGALIKVTITTKAVIKTIYDDYHKELPKLMQLVKFLEKFEDGEMFYYFDGEHTSVQERLTAIQCLPYFPKKGFVGTIHNKFFHYYFVMNSMFEHYSFGFDDIECKVGEEDKEKRCCRFCNTTGKSNFRKIAHAIPEALGNKLLFCNEECDSCNSRLASVESHFVHLMDIRRALFRVPTKKTSKIISLYGDNFTLLPDDQGTPNLYVKREEVKHKGNGWYSYHLKNSSEVTNEGIYKALVKMAIDLMPTSELSHFKNTITWINGGQTDWNLPNVFYAVRSPKEHLYLQPRLDLFFNTQQKYIDSPYCTAILFTTDIQYIFVVPFVDIDMGQFKYNEQLLEHWKRMFAMLPPRRQWMEQNTSDSNPAYTWLDFEFSANNKNIHILDGIDDIFKKYKTEEEKWFLNNHQFPIFEQKSITVESVSNVCFENLCNRRVSQKELSDVSVNHILGDSSVEMDVSNKRILVRLKFEVFNSDNTIPFFRCKGMVKLEAKSMEKFVLVTENNDTTNIEVDWSFYKSVVLKSAKAIEKNMRKQRVGTSFVNCSFESAFDNERIIRAIQVRYV